MEADAVIDKNPNFDLVQWRFLYSQNQSEEVKAKLIDAIRENNMAPLYIHLCDQFKWEKDEAFLATMREENQRKLNEIEDKLKDAEENLGDNEVREALLARAEYLSRIGAKDEALTAYRLTAEKTVPLGQRLDVVFSIIRIGLFFEDHDVITRNIEKAQSMIEEGGDWDRKNRLKVVEAMYSMMIRDFSKAALLFLETLSTFTSYELFDFDTFIFYTVIMSLVSLDRPKLKEKVLNAPEILSVIDKIPHLGSYLNSLYNSDYRVFFASLAAINNRINSDWLLSAHSRYYCREMRIRAYAQLLESYRSVQLESMANAFGVTVDFIDRELSRFIAAGRLHCKIDKTGGIVETTRPDSKNAQYQATIKQGDLLLNRIQKLSRVINL